jgi:hypothetical protein
MLDQSTKNILFALGEIVQFGRISFNIKEFPFFLPTGLGNPHGLPFSFADSPLSEELPSMNVDVFLMHTSVLQITRIQMRDP